jgi:hypothetical protein
MQEVEDLVKQQLLQQERKEKFVKYEKSGWVNVGAARMCVLDIAGAFYGIRKSFDALLGPVEKTVMYTAGEAGATTFVKKTLKTGVIPVSAEGFKLCVEAYIQSGFGDFRVEELDFENATAVVSGRYAFEAWAWLQHDDQPKTGVCDYTRGTFLAYMKVLTERDDLACVEVACEACGAGSCTFLVAPKEYLKQLGYVV